MPTMRLVRTALRVILLPCLLTSSCRDSTGVRTSDIDLVAFESNRTGNLEIYVIGIDGTGLARLTAGSADSHSASWSPDGKKIAFASNRAGNWEIYVMDRDGTNVVRLTDHPAMDDQPRWAPDGTTLAFISDRNGTPGVPTVHVMTADGKQVRRVTSDGREERDPAWSPDGTRLTFGRLYRKYPGGREDRIHIINIDGTRDTDLTTPPQGGSFSAGDYSPRWSPDGKRIVFARATYFSFLYVMNADGSELKPLIDPDQYRALCGCAGGFQPSWSPDGNKIVFADGGDLTIVNSDGTGARKVFEYPAAFDANPDWRPTSR
jgi:TolB protein